MSSISTKVMAQLHVARASSVEGDTSFFQIITIQLSKKEILGFLGHLSHSGDLLLWVGVRRRLSCVVGRALTSSSQELLGQS